MQTLGLFVPTGSNRPRFKAIYPILELLLELLFADTFHLFQH